MKESVKRIHRNAIISFYKEISKKPRSYSDNEKVVKRINSYYGAVMFINDNGYIELATNCQKINQGEQNK